jgi:hypothetical protein
MFVDNDGAKHAVSHGCKHVVANTLESCDSTIAGR